MRRLLLAALFLTSVLGDPLVLSPVERKLQGELMAPCCYHETVDRHESDAAIQMRAEIHALVAAGQSEREILEHYKAKYGERILAEPEGATWLVGFSVPFVVFAAGIAFVVRMIWKWSGGRFPALS